MIRWLLDENAGHFWWLAESENLANTDFENLKHLENPGHLFLKEPSMSEINFSKTKDSVADPYIYKG